MLIAVTGASGHVGNNLVRALVEAGHQVRALVHRDREPLEGLPVEIVQIDVLDLASLERAFQGVEVVFHLAAHISLMESGPEALRLNAANVQGTKNTVAAALSCQVRRLVHVSSIEALLHPDKPSPIDETPVNPQELPTLYGRSKALGNQEILAGIARGLDAVIVYPTAVVGPYDFKPSMFGQMFLDFGQGRLPALTPGGFDLVDVRDLIQGLLSAMQRGRSGEGYLLSGRYVSVAEIASVLEQATGARRPWLVVPFWLMLLAATFTPLFYRLSQKRPRFTRMTVHMLGDGRTISREKALHELGYSPRDPTEGIRAALLWLQETGRLPREQSIYGSKVDRMIAFPLAAATLVSLLGGIQFLTESGAPRLGLGALAIALPLLFLWLTIPTRYLLCAGELHVRAGPFRWRIPTDSIVEVTRSRNPFSAPAWSFDRLKITYLCFGKKSTLLISPHPREPFLSRLREQIPSARIEG